MKNIITRNDDGARFIETGNGTRLYVMEDSMMQDPVEYAEERLLESGKFTMLGDIGTHNVETEKEGIKFDSEKPDYSLIPPRALDDLVRVLSFGAAKYDRDNWKELEDLENRYFAAAQRHMWQWKRGEILDNESGLPHLAHAATCLFFLNEFTYIKNDE
jgi:hypothetical protein